MNVIRIFTISDNRTMSNSKWLP